MIDAAYDACLRLARAHYENFPVASKLLPPEARPHIAAVYAFARIADDYADEGDRTIEARLALLDGWRERLRATVDGRPIADGTDAALVFEAVGDTIRRFALEPALFEDLLSAFRQDVTVTRYETWTDLLDYARRSANPVGRLVLRIAGYRDASMDVWSDAVCTALQLTNFWQDLERDWHKGRVYVPQETLARAGADERDLDRARWTPQWRAAMTEAGERTRQLFDRGRPIADAVGGRLRWELRATWLGGVRILDRLAARGYDVFDHRPKLGPPDLVTIGWRTLTWRPMPAVASR